MKCMNEYLHCGDTLLVSLRSDIQEVFDTISNHPWLPHYSCDTANTTIHHQAAYNHSLASGLSNRGWRLQPKLSESPRLIGDFAKGDVFGEIQFGNSAALYRDFYKFQYGYQNSLLQLAVLIVPYNEYMFFPTRRKSVRNMANFALALRYFTVLPILVPTLIFGLLADNEEAPK